MNAPTRSSIFASRRGWWRAQREVLIVYAALLGLCIAGYAVSPNFFSQFNLTSIIGASLPLALAAIGQTFVIVSGGIDLSMGMVMSLSSVVAALYMNGNGSKLPVAVLMCLGIGLATGLVNGFVVVYLRVQPIIATLGTLSILQGLTLVRTNTPSGLAPQNLQGIIYNKVGPIPESLILLVAVYALAYVVISRTRYGVHTYAVGGDEESARLSGVTVPRVKVAAYVASGLAASCAGLLLLARLSIGDPTAGQPFMLLTIVAAAIGGINIFGGRGSMIGTLAGVMIVTALGNVMSLAGVSSYPQQLIYGLLIIGVVGLYSARFDESSRLAALARRVRRGPTAPFEETPGA